MKIKLFPLVSQTENKTVLIYEVPFWHVCDKQMFAFSVADFKDVFIKAANNQQHFLFPNRD